MQYFFPFFFFLTHEEKNSKKKHNKTSFFVLGAFFGNLFAYKTALFGPNSVTKGHIMIVLEYCSSFGR